ncbi:MAG: glycosyltransferase, partial [Cytophagaceae bacterium]
YIIGGKADSTERDRLVTRIKEQGLQNHVFLTGFVDYKELSDHFLMADCFVLPSKKEGFGIVFIESAACGCKVLAGNKDGSPDALLDGKLGTLIDPDDRREVLSALTAILENPNTKEDSMKIQTKCLEHFSYQAYKENVKSLLLQRKRI